MFAPAAFASPQFPAFTLRTHSPRHLSHVYFNIDMTTVATARSHFGEPSVAESDYELQNTLSGPVAVQKSNTTAETRGVPDFTQTTSTPSTLPQSTQLALADITRRFKDAKKAKNTNRTHQSLANTPAPAIHAPSALTNVPTAIATSQATTDESKVTPPNTEASTIDLKCASNKTTSTTSPVNTSKDRTAPDLLRRLDPKVADMLETLSKEVGSSGLFDDTTTGENPLGPDKISKLVKDLEKKLAAKELARADLTTQARILEETVDQEAWSELGRQARIRVGKPEPVEVKSAVRTLLPSAQRNLPATHKSALKGVALGESTVAATERRPVRVYWEPQVPKDIHFSTSTGEKKLMISNMEHTDDLEPLHRKGDKFLEALLEGIDADHQVDNHERLSSGRHP